MRTVSLHHTALAVFYTGCCVLGMVFTVFTYLILIKADLSFSWFGKIQSGLSIFETDQYFTHHFCVFSHKVLVLWLNWKRNTNLLSWIVKGLFAMERILRLFSADIQAFLCWWTHSFLSECPKLLIWPPPNVPTISLHFVCKAWGWSFFFQLHAPLTTCGFTEKASKCNCHIWNQL